MKTNKNIDLPVDIPILPDRFKTRQDYRSLKFIGVYGSNMFSRNGEKINNSYTKYGYAAKLNIDPKTKALL